MENSEMGKRSQKKIITREVKIIRAIRAIREKRKLSVQLASEVIGTNKSTLTALENGRIDLSADWIKRILKGYYVNMESFQQMIDAKDSIREEIVSEVNEMLLKLSYTATLRNRKGSSKFKVLEPFYI